MTNSDKITINLKAVLLLAILAIMQVLPIIASDKDSIALVNANGRLCMMVMAYS